MLNCVFVSLSCDKMCDIIRVLSLLHVQPCLRCYHLLKVRVALYENKLKFRFNLMNALGGLNA